MRLPIFLFVLVACEPHGRVEARPEVPTAAQPRTASVTIETESGPLKYVVELAIQEKERNRGLMFREHLDDDAGMLFIFERQTIQSFWMKNTKIPLDMIFIAEDGTIAGIVENAEPMTLTSRQVDKPSRYVLELNAGTCRRMGIAPGQRVRFEGVPPELVDIRVLATPPKSRGAAQTPQNAP